MNETVSIMENVGDCISRQAAQHKINALIDEFETIMKEIRERNVDDSVCGLCEYDGAFMSDSGNWCNECPGFERDDCFKLKDQYREEWAGSIKNLPSVQLGTNLAEVGTNLVSKQAAIDALDEQIEQCNRALGSFDISPKDEYAVKVEMASLKAYKEQLENLPTVQHLKAGTGECDELCKYYDKEVAGCIFFFMGSGRPQDMPCVRG